MLVAAITADQLTTAYGIRRYGLRIEANPVMRAVWRRWGGGGALLFQSAVLFPVLWLAQRLAPDLAFIIPLIVLAAAANNLRVAVLKARRRRLRAASRRASESGIMGD